LAFVASLGLRVRLSFFYHPFASLMQTVGRAKILPHPLIPTHITHASPQEALKLHVDVRSLHSLGATNPPFFLLYPSAQSNVVYAIGMHFATFAGSDVEALEPLLELENAKARMRLGLGGSHKEDTKQVGGTDKGKGKAADEGEWGKGKDGWMINAGFGWLDIGETATLRVGARVSLPGGGG
jgi:N-acyl-phosphatidylethanolamine-hydrolysing phospholipase D